MIGRLARAVVFGLGAFLIVVAVPMLAEEDQGGALRRLIGEIGAFNHFFADLDAEVARLDDAAAWIEDAEVLGSGWDEAAMNGAVALTRVRPAVAPLRERAAALTLDAPHRPPFYNYTSEAQDYAAEAVAFLEDLAVLLEQDVAAARAQDLQALAAVEEARRRRSEEDSEKFRRWLEADLDLLPADHPSHFVLRVVAEQLSVAEAQAALPMAAGPAAERFHFNAMAARHRAAAVRIATLAEGMAATLPSFRPKLAEALGVLFEEPARVAELTDRYVGELAEEAATLQGYSDLHARAAALHQRLAEGEESQGLYEAFVRLESDRRRLAERMDSLFVGRYDMLEEAL